MNNLFSDFVNPDKKTMLKMIREAHYRGWLVVRDDLIDRVKHQLSDKELNDILNMIKISH